MLLRRKGASSHFSDQSQSNRPDVQDVNEYVPEALVLLQRSKSHQWHTCVNLLGGTNSSRNALKTKSDCKIRSEPFAPWGLGCCSTSQKERELLSLAVWNLPARGNNICCISTSICGRKWKRKGLNISWLVDLAPCSKWHLSRRPLTCWRYGQTHSCTQIDALHTLNHEQRK
jgi:hypothetical protein